jgi:hypothetical protein
MEFIQSRKYEGFNLSYELKYEKNDPGDEIEGILELKLGDNWGGENISTSINIEESVDGEVTIANSNTNVITFNVLLKYDSITSQGKFTIELGSDSDDLNEKIHIRLPSVYLLDLYQRLLQDEVPIQAHEQLEQILEEDSFEIGLYDIINGSALAVERRDFFNIINEMIEFSDELKYPIRDIVSEVISDWTLSKNTGNFYQVDSIEELKDISQMYQRQSNTQKFEEHILEKIIQLRADYINRGFNNFIKQNITNAEFPLYDISLESFVFILGHLTHEATIEEISDYLKTHAKDIDIHNDIKKCIDADKSLRCYRDQIPLHAAKGDIESVRYGIGKTIFSYFIDRQNEIDYITEAFLYEAIEELYKNKPDIWLSEHARHNRHLKLGEKYRDSEPETAQQHFDSAIIAISEANNWNPDPHQHAWAVYRKSVHEAEMLNNRGLYEEAIDRLSERKDIIKQIEDSGEDDGSGTITLRLEGRINEYKADKYLNNDQLQKALTRYNKAAGNYNQGDWDKLFQGSKARELQVEALISELEGDFDSAAEKHDEFANKLPHSDGYGFHLTRKQVCLAKSHAMERNYEEAVNLLDSLEKEVDSQLNPSENQLRHLLKAACSFGQGNEDNIEAHIQTLIASLSEEDEERLLNFSDDYTTGHLTALAVQRLSSLPISEEDLNNILHIAIKDACYPAASQTKVEPPIEKQASPTVGEIQKWEFTLPSHIINKLEKLRVSKQQTFEDFDSLVRDLVTTTEALLQIPVEYHSKLYWGEDWESEVPGRSPPSLGGIYDFYKMNEGPKLNSREDIVNLFEEEIIADKLFKNLRNDVAHGKDPQLTRKELQEVNEEQFNQIYQNLIEAFRITTTDLPVIGLVEHKPSIDTYILSLKWGGLRKKVWITTEKSLEKNGIYYFPRQELEGDYSKSIEVTADSIVKCVWDANSHYAKDDSTR